MWELVDDPGADDAIPESLGVLAITRNNDSMERARKNKKTTLTLTTMLVCHWQLVWLDRDMRIWCVRVHVQWHT